MKTSRTRWNQQPSQGGLVIAVSMQSELGSIRALACSDRRPAGRSQGPKQSPNGGLFIDARVVGGGADHRTRGRVCSPVQLNRHGLGLPSWARAALLVRGILFRAAVAVASALGAAQAAELDLTRLPPAATVHIDFDKDIRPILETSCLRCHGPEKPKSRFRLDNREDALKGGDHGIAIISGQSAKSPLIHFIAHLDPDTEMPPRGKADPLTKEQIGLVRAWIDQGVSWPAGKGAGTMLFSVSPTVRWVTVSGNERKFREDWWGREGFTGGGERFEWRQPLSKDSELYLEGHARYEDDYRLSLRLSQTDLGFLRGGYSQSRKYFDDSGGEYEPSGQPAYRLDRDLHVDLGKAWIDLGLTLPHWPRMVLGYEHQSRDGAKSSLQWDAVGPAGNERAIYPAAKDIRETVDIVKFDLTHDVRGISIEDNFRGEFYKLETQRESVSFLETVSAVPDSVIRWRDQAEHFQGSNALRLEKQVKEWMLLSGGYLYSRLEGDAAFSLETFFPSDPTTPPFLGDVSNQIVLKRESHIFNGSSLWGPWQGLSLTAGVQNEWTRQKGLGSALSSGVFPNLYNSDLDRMVVEEDLGMRYTKIPFTVLFLDTRFQQETLGQYEKDFIDDRRGDDHDFLRDTDADSDLKQYRGGFTLSPWPRTSLHSSFKHQLRQSDFHDLQDTDQSNPARPPFGLPGNGYPAFIQSRGLETDEFETKLVVRMTSWLKTTLKYQLVSTDYRSVTDPSQTSFPKTLYPGGEILAGHYDAHVYSLNTTLTPWRRLYLSGTFSYGDSRLRSGVNNDTSVVPYRGGTYTVLSSATFVLNETSDLHASSSFSRADYGQNNAHDGLPLGLVYDRHGVIAGLRRQLKKNLSTNLQYGFFRYRESVADPSRDYTAHAVFATLNMSLP